MLGLLLVSPVSGAAPVIDQAWAGFRQQFLVESFGLFWIAAELAILFCMGVAVRVFGARPVPRRLALTAAERRRALAWCAAFGGLALLVYARHLIVPPLPQALMSIAETSGQAVQDARAAYLARANLHAGLWSAFIVGWVALEIAIVAQGVRAYRRLAGLIAESRHAG